MSRTNLDSHGTHLSRLCGVSVLLSLLTVPSLARAGSPGIDGTWTQLSPTVSPPKRNATALLYDSHRHRALLFGGFDTNQTWSLDLDNPTTWQLVPVKGFLPLPRGDANVVYDPVNDRLWMWGGHHSSGATYGDPGYLQLTDVPNDSANWVAFSPEREPGTGNLPTPRYASGTVYDPEGQRMIFYGGGYGTGGLATGGTWALTLDALPTWHLLPMASPYTHGGAYSNLFIDPTQHQLVLYSTLVASNYWQFPWWPYGDVYTAPLSGAPGWTLIAQGNSDSLQYQIRQAAYHPLQDRMISLVDTELNGPGTYWGSGTPGAWSFGFSPGIWTHLYPLSAPGPASADDIIYDPVVDRMVVVRNPGSSGTVMETWFLTWSGTSGVPEPGVLPSGLLRAGAPRPNPSSGNVALSLSLRSAVTIHGVIVDPQGRLVRDLGTFERSAGESSVVWDGRNDRGENVKTGVYFARFTAEGERGNAVVRVVRSR